MSEKGYSKELMQAMQRPLVKKKKEIRFVASGLLCPQHSRMHPEMQAEVVDIMIAAVDKFTDNKGPNTELATKLVKETLDRQYGGPWHCIIGEEFAYDVTAQEDALLLVFYQGDLSILIFKC